MAREADVPHLAEGVVSPILDQQRFPALHTPNGLLLDGASHLLLADFGTGVSSNQAS